jgi:hypothetical protein
MEGAKGLVKVLLWATSYKQFGTGTLSTAGTKCCGKKVRNYFS